MAELPLVSLLDRALFFRAQPYFAGLEAGVVAVLAKHSRERFFRRGEWVFEEARPIDRVLFLVEGRVRGERPDGQALWDVAAPGGVGLAHFLARTPEPPRFRALCDVVAVEIEFENFMQILEDHFPLVLQMARTLSRLIGDAERTGDSATPAAVSASAACPDAVLALDLVERLAYARQSPFFARTNLTIVAELFRAAREIRLAPGESLYEIGEEVRSAALLVAGRMRIAGLRSERAEAGDQIGLWDLLTDLPRERSALAETEARLLLLDRAHYTDLLEDHFDLACEVLGHLARRYIAVQTRTAATSRRVVATGSTDANDATNASATVSP